MLSILETSFLHLKLPRVLSFVSYKLPHKEEVLWWINNGERFYTLKGRNGVPPIITTVKGTVESPKKLHFLYNLTRDVIALKAR